MQIAENILWVGISAQFHHYPHSFSVAFVANIGNATDFSIVNKICQFFDPASFAELIGQFSDDNSTSAVPTLTRLYFFDMGHATHWDAAASFEVGFMDASAQQDLSTSWKVWARN